MARMVLIMALTMETVLTGALILLIMDLLTPRRLLTMVTLPSPSLEVTLPLLTVLPALVILTMATPRHHLHLLIITKMDLTGLTTADLTILRASALRGMRVTHHHLLLTIPSL